MALDLTKVFKGIQQVKALPATPEKGVIYFVRHHGEDGNPTGNASIYFGGRLYGNVETTRLAKIESDILALDGRVDAIEGALGKWTEEFTGNLETVASVVKAHDTKLGEHAKTLDDHSNRLDTIELKFDEEIGSGFDKDNSVYDNITRLDGLIGNGFANDDSDITAEILKIKESLEPEGATAKAIADAQGAANKAQGEVDALEAVVGAPAKGETAASGIFAEIARVEGIADAARTEDEVNAQIDTKIAGLNSASHTHDNKALLDTYTQTEENLADAVSKKHEHTNKTELDKFVDGDKKKWDDHVATTDIHVTAKQKTDWQEATDAINAFLAAEGNTSEAIDTLKEIQDFLTSDDGTVKTLLDKVDAAQADVDALEVVVGTKADGEKVATGIFAEIARVEGIADAARTEDEVNAQIDTKIAGLNSASHTHSNKALLDTYTQTEENLADAVSKKHEHTNKTELDKFVDGDKAKLDTAVQTVSVAEGCEMLGATKEGTTVTLALYYGGDDAE